MTESVLLEIGLEELPAQYVRSSSEQLGERVADFFKEAHLSYQSLEVFATPRRLAVRVNQLAEKQPDRVEVFKGPSLAVAKKDGAWTKAAEGFVRGKGLTVNDIYVESVQGTDYIHVQKAIKGKSAKEVVKNLSTVITEMKFPVTMRWANHTFEYLRPIHWIVALYGTEVIKEVQVLSIVADRISKGHRFLGNDVSIEHPNDYEQRLKEKFVIAHQDERKELVRQQIEALAAKNQWEIPIDEELLEEVSSILEYPTAFSGKFADQYLTVPAPVLETSMKEHQRYFVVYDQKGNLLPYFVSVRNGDRHAIENVIAGNQKVLTARLEDALFFYQEDRKVSILSFLNKLETLNFHAKIGTMTEKMERVQQLVTKLAQALKVSGETVQTAQRASMIYKFDLVTNMVGEFPELQGQMGEIYALEQGETPAVATAIREHYLPTSADGALPQTDAGALLAIADKLDTFLSFMTAGLIPTGSNDPYALRRQVMGIVQILEHQHWSLELKPFIKNELALSLSTLPVAEKETLLQQIFTFLEDRVAQRLSYITPRHDVIQAMIHSETSSVPKQIEMARVLTTALEQESLKMVVEAFNRVLNISLKEFNRADFATLLQESVRDDLLQTDSERQLVAKLETLKSQFDSLDSAEQFEKLKEMVPFISTFFEENMVMVEDEAIRRNRLTFLRQLSYLLLVVADFSYLQIK